MDLLHGALDPDDPALEMALAQALLRRVSRGESGPALRVYRPRSRVVAFGRRDVRLGGFASAVALARREGFTPVVRAPGGRAVAYTPRALVVDHVSPDPQWPSGMDRRFTEYGELWAEVLRGRGVDARVGEVPGEYCPGSCSVNARGEVKLVGTAQRMVRGAWLFSAVLIFDDAPVLRPLLAGIYETLELPFADSSVGSVVEEAPGLGLDTVESSVLAAYDGRFGLRPAALDDELMAEANGYLGDHRP